MKSDYNYGRRNRDTKNTEEIIIQLAFFITLIAKSRCVPRTYAKAAAKLLKELEI